MEEKTPADVNEKETETQLRKHNKKIRGKQNQKLRMQKYYNEDRFNQTNFDEKPVDQTNFNK